MDTLFETITLAVFRLTRDMAAAREMTNGCMVDARARYQNNQKDDGEYQKPETLERFFAYFLDELELQGGELSRLFEAGSDPDPDWVQETVKFLHIYSTVCHALYLAGHTPESSFYAFRQLPVGVQKEHVLKNIVRQVNNPTGPYVWFCHTYDSVTGLARIFGKLSQADPVRWRLVAHQQKSPGPETGYWTWAEKHEGAHDREFVMDWDIYQLNLPDDIYRATPVMRQAYRQVLEKYGMSEYEIKVALDPQRRHFYDESFGPEED